MKSDPLFEDDHFGYIIEYGAIERYQWSRYGFKLHCDLSGPEAIDITTYDTESTDGNRLRTRER